MYINIFLRILIYLTVVCGLCACDFSWDFETEDEGLFDPPSRAQPIYMSYEDLREPLKLDTERTVEKLGKIYLYQDLVFANEPNQGIHVVDNRDPSQPEYLFFMNIPGNVDIAVKDGFLYADSYVDLVVIDINNLFQVNTVKRIENIFPYNPYQNIPERIYFNDVDESKGVVVGYTS